MDNKIQLKIVETGDFAGEVRPEIHKLANSRELFDLYRLTYECYQADGHPLPNADGLWIPHPEFDHLPTTTIFIAQLGGEMVGTVSITMDGTLGLPLDKKFPNTCRLNRLKGRRVAQVWRLLVRESCPIKSSIVVSLLTEATQRLMAEGAQTCLYVVQEKLTATCCDLLNAIVLTSIASAPGLPHSKSVLMLTELDGLKCTMPIQGGQHEPTAYLSRR